MNVAGRRAVWTIAGLLWIAAVVAGLAALMNYDNAPGAGAAAPQEWPADSALVRDASGPTLLMLAHPQCDCTRASLSELAELLARATRPPTTYVVFIKPGQVSNQWERTGLWQRAADLPGVTIFTNDEGTEARRFGVHTSGQILLYDAAGRLQYSGGTTGSRGKTGLNLGRTAILDVLNGRPSLDTRPVFGCPLFAEGDERHPSTPHEHGPVVN
jgi:hypothetical protein